MHSSDSNNPETAFDNDSRPSLLQKTESCDDMKATNQLLLQELAKERQRVSTLEGIILSMFLSPGAPAEVKAKAEEFNSSIPLLLHGKEHLLNGQDALTGLVMLNPLCHRCSQEERAEKIARYKAKQKKRRECVQLSRSYSGRSVVAKTKPRVNGKFASHRSPRS